jgi:cell division protein FtsI (penicillin-binding protein 3)
VAGKTGTAWFYNAGGGYDNENYNAYFAGIVPADNPRIVAIVSIHQPQGKETGGGTVAAPAFAKIAAGAMRILDVPPENDVADGSQISMTDRQYVPAVPEELSPWSE